MTHLRHLGAGRFALALALALFSRAAGAAEPASGITIGAEARGVRESESVDGGATRERFFNVVEPKIGALWPSPALRLVLRYHPMIFIPVRSLGDRRFAQSETTVFHVGDLEISSRPARWLILEATDELRAAPLRFTEAIDAPDRLEQTNDARARIIARRGRRGGVELGLEGHRFDVAHGLITETDDNGNGVVDPSEDLNGNSVFDRGLKPSFSEGLGSAALWRRLSLVDEVRLFGAGSARQYDDLPRDNYVSERIGIEATHRARETLDVHLRVAVVQYQFDRRDDLTGYDGALSASLQATRTLQLELSGGGQRTVDPAGNPAEIREAALTAHQEIPRGFALELQARLARFRTPGVKSSSYPETDSGSLGGEASMPLHGSLRLKAGVRVWRGGGKRVQWITNELAFVGVSWE